VCGFARPGECAGVVDGKLRCEPHLPKDLETLRLAHIGFRGRYVDMG
jgi:hypothetical protein